MSLRLVLFIYNIVFPIALLFLLPGYLLKIFRRGNYSNSFGERFGIYSSEKKEKNRGEERDGARPVSTAPSAQPRSVAESAEKAPPASIIREARSRATSRASGLSGSTSSFENHYMPKFYCNVAKFLPNC